MNCEYCKKEDNKMFIFKFIPNFNQERAVFINGDDELEMAVCNEKWEKEDSIKIKYCPMCGRKLETEEVEE